MVRLVFGLFGVCLIVCVAECFDFMFVICMFRFSILCLDVLICDLMFLCVGVLICLPYLCYACDFMFAFCAGRHIIVGLPSGEVGGNRQMTCL